MDLKKFFVFLFWACSCGSVCSAFCGRDTLYCRFYFPAGSSTMNLSYRNNGLRLDSLLSSIHSRQEHSVLRRVSLHSKSSPEGNSALNRRLSDERLASLRSAVQERLFIPDSVFVSYSSGEDWEGLSSLVERSGMPYHKEALRILRETPVWVTRNGAVVDSRKRQLMNLRGGQVWRYMLEHFFPELRHCSVVECEFESIVAENEGVSTEEMMEAEQTDTVVLRDTVETVSILRDTVRIPQVYLTHDPNPFYMGVKTNLLYDALLVPNIGLEVYLGKGWSVSGNWMYAWWKSDSGNRYWRVYGGEIGLRKYLGWRAADKPLTGHHVGVYGQVVTYDFKTGGRGYIGGRPGGSLWEKANYGAGIEYGYSLPIGKRLNLDFSLGLGYLGGTYYEYAPIDGHYVWEETKVRHWLGPTKAEISLVWLLGGGNCNKKKGGKQ